jgi:hypothetical protein
VGVIEAPRVQLKNGLFGTIEKPTSVHIADGANILAQRQPPLDSLFHRVRCI